MTGRSFRQVVGRPLSYGSELIPDRSEGAGEICEGTRSTSLPDGGDKGRGLHPPREGLRGPREAR